MRFKSDCAVAVKHHFTKPAEVIGADNAATVSQPNNSPYSLLPSLLLLTAHSLKKKKNSINYCSNFIVTSRDSCALHGIKMNAHMKQKRMN